MESLTPTNQHFRDVYLVSTRQPIQKIRLVSDAEISAYDALNVAAKHLPPPELGECRYLKVYCGGSN